MGLLGALARRCATNREIDRITCNDSLAEFIDESEADRLIGVIDRFLGTVESTTRSGITPRRGDDLRWLAPVLGSAD